MSEKLNIGFIGAGNIAKRHADALQRIDGVNVVGHWTPQNKERPPELGVRKATSGELFNVSDAVFICVPPHETGRKTKRAIQERMPFFIEKPLDLHPERPPILADRVQELSLPTAVGYQWRASDAATYAREILAEQEAPLTQIVASYLDQAALYAGDWWIDRRKSGGPMVEQATHIADQLRFLAGEFKVEDALETFSVPPEFLIARPALQKREDDPTRIPTRTMATLRFDKDVPGELNSSAISSQRKVDIVFSYEDGTRIIVERGKVTKRRAGRETVLFEDPDFVMNSTVKQDAAFIASVRANDPTLVFSSYPDAAKTHGIVMEIDRKARAS
jgi:myo-inositol 2-dehydrogenase / D-chiro-inositol 1-dehydrogenase